MNSINSSFSQTSFIDELNSFLIQSFYELKKFTYKHHKILGYF
jgi:hypothetical protein